MTEPLHWGLGIYVRHGPCTQEIHQLMKDDPQVKGQLTLTKRLCTHREEAWVKGAVRKVSKDERD